MKKLHPTVKSLLADIEAYCARSGTDRTTFGKMVANDGHLISRMEQGRTPTLKMIDRVRAFIDSKTKATRPRK